MMTVLEKINLGKDIYLNVYEAVVHSTNGEQRREWARDGVPCFEDGLLQLWNLRRTPLPGEEPFEMEIEWEQEEKRRYLHYPVRTLTEESKGIVRTVGGLWTYEVRANRHEEKTVDICMKVAQDKRNFAFPLFENFLEFARRNYHYVFLEWGNRKNPRNDPTKFLKHYGFEITERLGYKEGLLKL